MILAGQRPVKTAVAHSPFEVSPRGKHLLYRPSVLYNFSSRHTHLTPRWKKLAYPILSDCAFFRLIFQTDTIFKVSPGISEMSFHGSFKEHPESKPTSVQTKL